MGRAHPPRLPRPDLPPSRALARSPAPPTHLPLPEVPELYPPGLSLPQEGQGLRGRSLVLEEQSNGRRPHVFPFAGLSGAPPQLLYLSGPGSAPHEEVVARLSFAAITPPAAIGLSLF